MCVKLQNKVTNNTSMYTSIFFQQRNAKYLYSYTEISKNRTISFFNFFALFNYLKNAFIQVYISSFCTYTINCNCITVLNIENSESYNLCSEFLKYLWKNTTI